MATGVLGKPHRVNYISKNLVGGLANIKAWVIKPDLTKVGPFNLTEFSESEFAGFYYFDFVTTVSDDPGEYIGVVSSPNESNHRAPFKIVYTEETQLLEAIDDKTENLPPDPASDTIVCEKAQDILDDLVDVVRIDDLAAIDGAFNFQARMSTVYKDDTGVHEILTWLDRGNTRLINTKDCVIKFYRSNGSLVWQDTLALPNAQGFFKLESNSLSLGPDENFYVIIDITDGDDITHSTTLPTVTVG